MPQEPSPRMLTMITGSSAFPFGNNSAPLVVNYNERVKYRLGNYFEGLPKPIDTFYDKVFYGKVDRFQNVIIPRRDTTLIKQTSDSSNVFAFNFVSDAFFKLKRNLKIAGDSGGIYTTETNFYQIESTGGWKNWEPIYSRQVKKVFVAYNAYLQTLSKDEFNKIRNVKEYADSLLNYLKTGDYKRPITLTELALARVTPYTMTGISLEISNDSYSDDSNKYINYFLDINFPYYVRAARKFGFYVDKNAPWRLFADVNSKPMLEELANYNTNEENFFDNYFERTYTLDLDLFKKELVIAYNDFARANYVIREATTPTIACPVSRVSIIGIREQINILDVNNIGDPYWLSYYFNIRLLESGIKYKNSSTLIEESIKIARVFGYDKALIYINNLFKPYLYDERLFNTNLLTDTPDTVRVGSVEDAPVSIVGGTEGSSY